MTTGMELTILDKHDGLDIHHYCHSDPALREENLLLVLNFLFSPLAIKNCLSNFRL